MFSNLNAQNYLLEKDQSGIIIQGSYSDSEGNALFGIIPSLNINGIFSVGVGLQRFNSTDISGYKTTPYVSCLFLKKTNNTGITNLGLGAYYTFENDDKDIINAYAWAFGPEFSYQFIFENNFKIGLRTVINIGSLETERDYMNFKRGFLSSGLSTNFVHKNFFLEVSYGITRLHGKHGDYTSSISFSLGYMFK